MVSIQPPTYSCLQARIIVQSQYFRCLKILAAFFCAVQSYAANDLKEQSYGPSEGRIPIDYYYKIKDNLGNKTLVKEWAELAIGHFLDDDCPLPKNIAGIFRNEKGNDSPVLYRSHEGGDDLMWALLQIYKKYPDDADAQNYYQKVIQFADVMLEHGTDRYGSVSSPLFSSILTRDLVPQVPEDPENPGNGVRVERHTVYSFSRGSMRENWCAVGVGNMWYGGNESHKSSWRGTDMARDEKLYELLYELSEATGDQKYKDAANASIVFWLANCPTETNLFPWGEHAGWNFFTDEYDKDYYRCRYHEFKEGESLYDKFIELQPRVRKGEFTVMEKFALAHVPTGTGEIRIGSQEGMFIYGRHQPLWADRETAMEEHPDLLGFGNFPRIPGSWLYSQAIAYNRSNNPTFRDLVLTDMNIIADGLEQQRSMLDLDYYPYTYPIWISDGSYESIRNNQNDRLGYSVKRAHYLMEQASVNDEIINKLNVIWQVALTAAGEPTGGNPAVVGPYHGPSMVTGLLPEDGSSVLNFEVVLKWAESQGAISYDLYLAEDAGELRTATPESASFIGSTTANSWQLSKLEENKEYFWAVDAVGENGIRKGEILIFD